MEIFQKSFCDTPLWDLQITWYTEQPNFTTCFQNTVLVWIPCLFLWVFLPTYLYTTWKRKGPALPWSWLNIMKLVFSLGLISITISEMVIALQRQLGGTLVPRVTFCSAGIKIITFVIAAVLQLRDKKIGKRSSGFLFLFWFLLAACGLIAYRSELLQIIIQNEPIGSGTNFVVTMIYYPLVVGQFLFSAFSEKRMVRKSDGQRYPLTDEPFLSLFLFAWFERLVISAYRRTLELIDLYQMSPEYMSEDTCRRFYKYWNDNKQRITKSTSREMKAKAVKTSPSITWALMRGFWLNIILGCLLELCYSFGRFIPILLINLLIDFATNNEPTWKGYLYAAVMFISSILNNMSNTHLLYYVIASALQIKSALIGAVYRKALQLSSSARRQYTLGELVNFMAVDTERIYNFAIYASLVFGAPIRIFLTIVFLWQYLGPACLVGLAVMIGMMPITGLIARQQHVVQEKQMELKDSRLKVMNEILNGIKVLKLYAWEQPFINIVLNIRQKEVINLRKHAFLNAGIAFIWACSPFLVALFSFLTYVMLDKNNILTAAKAFVSLTLFNSLRFSLVVIPDLISTLVQTRVSLNRLSSFFLAEDLDPSNVRTNPPKDETIAIEGGTFSWAKGEAPVLRSVDLHVKTGQLVAVVGRVGSGKSSLLSAILGEMDKLKGTVNLKGSKAYVPQLAWIQNATLQQNILFTHLLKPSKYQTVLEACCLLPDLAILPAGDQTEIGEKGVNLSGGQKHRVSLARAVYQNADLYLLDDPLSAVDSHVGKHIFHHVLGPEGLLRHKTRVLVTHNIWVLPEVDTIVVMNDGEIQETGTYKELMDKKGQFAEFIEEHLQMEDAESGLDSESASGSDGGRHLYSQLSVGSDTEVTSSKRQQRTISSRQVSVMGRAESVSSDHLPTNIDILGQLVEEEKMEVGKVKFDVYLKYLRNASYIFGVTTVFGYAFFQASEISASFWLSEWSNDQPLPDGTQNIPLRNLRLGIYGVFGGMEAVGILFAGVMLAIGAMRASRHLHHNMLLCIIHCPMYFFDTTPMGRILNRFGKDVDAVDSQLPSNFDAWCDCVLTVIGTCIVISINAASFLVAAIPISVLYYIVQKLFVATTRQLERLSSVTRSPVYTNFSEAVSGVSSVRAYGVLDFFIARSNNRVDANLNCVFNSMICNRWVSARLGILSGTIVLSTALLVVIGRGTLEAGLVGLSLSYCLTVMDAFTWMVRMSGELESRIVCVERIDEYSNLESEAPWEIAGKKPPKSWPEVGAVTFENYSTRYRLGLDLVLQDVQLSIHPKEKIGIVGRTGAGKSSLTLSLFRIIEAAKGAIYIDDVNVATIGLHDLRKKLSIIPQDPVLFTGTMRFNIDPNDDYVDNEIWEALEQAHLKSFVKSLPDTLKHSIAEGGENLSVGQRQLVCLARALLRKSRVLVLDEATAAVDLETDKLIQKTIRSEFAESTIITIAHRLHTILDYDRVVVMDKGRIVESGIPGDLMEKTDSYFHALAKDAGLV